MTTRIQTLGTKFNKNFAGPFQNLNTNQPHLLKHALITRSSLPNPFITCENFIDYLVRAGKRICDQSSLLARLCALNIYANNFPYKVERL
jgi:hypothetical protein